MHVTAAANTSCLRGLLELRSLGQDDVSARLRFSEPLQHEGIAEANGWPDLDRNSNELWRRMREDWGASNLH